MHDATSPEQSPAVALPPLSWEDGASLPPGIGERPLSAICISAAAARGDAIAVLERDGTRRLSHRALDERVGRWAARLAAAGLPPGAPVGLCAAADLAIPVGFLAILEWGGVVVPLDPALPAERLRAMARGVGCRLILAVNETRALFDGDLPLLNLDDDPGDHPPPAASGSANPDRVAALYHTSGSTGRPKPVALPHRALSARILSMMAWFGVNGDDVLCAGSTLAFDPFLQQLFFPLCAGGTLWLPDRHTLLDPTAFWEQAARFGVTHLNLVPSQIEALLRRPPSGGLPSLRRVVLGGERMPPDLPARVNAALGPVAVFNMYGPTEATVDATGWRADPTVTDREIPIGAPLPGCRVRILDDQLRRVPIGEAGELCIGGAGLALGYLGMEEATLQAFVADPFGAPGERLYRTGDQARWLPDGQIAFLGRQDDQVKIRGQRIELGEVEAALRAFPGVEAASVGKWEDAPGGAALVAHITGDVTGAPDLDGLRRWLSEHLPAAAVPAHILTLDRLPTLPSGKIDRKALPMPALSATAPAAAPPTHALDAAVLERRIAAVWADLLGRPTVDSGANLFEMGAHSLHVPRALIAIEDATGHRLGAVDLFRFPSVAALARHLSGDDATTTAPRRKPRRRATADDGSIAIVGMAFRFPGASDRAAFWDLLMAGTDCVRRFDPATLRQNGAPAALVDHPDFVPAHAAIDGTDRFDPQPFGYSHGEAAEIDPQQRILLELAWRALEDAACEPDSDGPVGVFAGVGFNSYLVDNLRDRIGFAGGTDRFSTVVGVDKDFAATRIAYKLGLTGPAMTVNSACSTALSATVTAVDSLRAGRCRVALAGAASLGMFSPLGHIHADGGIASRVGECRPFDAGADGVVAGAGAAVLVLKRLDDALEDGDRVHAVIKGIGVANDGAGKAAFSAPSVDGQASAIAAALEDAGVTPDQIGFVEGHGTATLLGDPIEVAALNLVYRGGAPGSALLGSVKGNIGHLDAASGMAGLIKAALALEHGVVPPTARFQTANPRIPFAEGPFRVNAQAEPFPGPADRPRLAGVSGFGMGGTNIHAILAAAPPVQPPVQPPAEVPAPGPVLLTLSAATPEARDQLADRLADHLTAHEVPLADAAATLARRRPLRRRRAVVASNPAEAAEALRAGGEANGLLSGDAPGGVAAAFLFPGQGAQQAGMARDLHRAIPAFRAVIDEADRILRGGPAEGLRALLLADPADGRATAALSETLLTQPALFVTEYATAKALESLGVRPSALIGHSVGEYVAACLSGVMGFEDALRLVAARARLMASAPRGAMLAISLPEVEILPLLAQCGADLAAVNAPRQCVAAGSEAQITTLAQMVAALGKPARRLAVSHAFHSALMEPILDAFAEELARAPLAAPTIPILSNVSGDWLRADEATDPAYWARHLRGTVRFADGLRRLIDADPSRLLIEAGPGATLSRLARGAGAPESRAIPAQPLDGGDGHAALLTAVGRVWVAGGTIDRRAAAGGSQRRATLPGYPFAPVRLWIEPGVGTSLATDGAMSVAPDAPVVGISATEAVIAALWRDVLGVPQVGPDDDFLALGGDSLIAVRIATRLRTRLGCEVAASALFRAGTVAGLARLLAVETPPEPDSKKQSAEEDSGREEGWL